MKRAVPQRIPAPIKPPKPPPAVGVGLINLMGKHDLRSTSLKLTDETGQIVTLIADLVRMPSGDWYIPTGRLTTKGA